MIFRLLMLCSLVALSTQWTRSDTTSGLTAEDAVVADEDDDLDTSDTEFNEERLFEDEDGIEEAGAAEGPVPELTATTLEQIQTTPITTTTLPPVTGAINICFSGDTNTQLLMERNGYNSSEVYYRDLIDIVNKAVVNLAPSVRVEFLGAQLYTIQMYMLWFNNYDTSEESLRTANTGFWDTAGTFNSYRGLGCDVAFYTTSEDYAFDFSNMIGLGNTLAMCGIYSHGMLKLFDDMERTAILLAHEIGHIIGVYHDDGTMNADYLPLMDTYPVEVGNIMLACELSPVLDGCDDPVGICVMDPSPYTTMGAPFMYSDCSHAYYDMYLKLSEDYPSWYQTECFVNDLA